MRKNFFSFKNLPIIDAHCHFSEAAKKYPFTPFITSDYKIASSSHSKSDFLETENLSAKFPEIKIKKTFGIHPENPDLQNASFLELLLKEKRIDAVGEAGFDLFSEKAKLSLEVQEEAWHAQCELAIKYNVPLVIHARKGLDLLYRDKALLSKIPAVVFHSFFWSVTEAESLLKKDINAHFSFGKQLLNSNKKARRAAYSLPISVLLTETDAPYGTLRGEKVTHLSEIQSVYAELARLRGCENEETFQSLCISLEANFTRVFGR